MKKVLILMAFMCQINNAMSQQTIPMSGNNGVINLSGSEYTNDVDNQYRISLTDPNGRVELTVDIDSEESYDYLYIYETNNDFSSLELIEGFTGTGSYTYRSYKTNGKLVVRIVTDGSVCSADGDGYDGFDVVYSLNTSPLNSFSSSGPSYMESHTTGPNFKINDPVIKSMGSLNSIATAYDNSLLLLKNSDYQLGIDANQIAANSNLGLSSTNSIYYNASNHIFNALSRQYALLIASNGNVGIGRNMAQGALEVYRDENPAIWLSSKNSTTLLAKSSCAGCYASYSRKGDGVLYNVGNESLSLVLNVFSSKNDGSEYVTIGDQKNGRTLSVFNNGKVTIGTINPNVDAKLAVEGTIKATEVKVGILASNFIEVDGAICANKIKVAANGQTADFVFEDGYDLKDLAEIEKYIKEHKHLPNIPSAQEMEANGVDLAEMNKLLLQKVEELTLYIVEQKNAMEQQGTEIKQLNSVVIKQNNDIQLITDQLAKLFSVIGADTK